MPPIARVSHAPAVQNTAAGPPQDRHSPGTTAGEVCIGPRPGRGGSNTGEPSLERARGVKPQRRPGQTPSRLYAQRAPSARVTAMSAIILTRQTRRRSLHGRHGASLFTLWAIHLGPYLSWNDRRPAAVEDPMATVKDDQRVLHVKPLNTPPGLVQRRPSRFVTAQSLTAMPDSIVPSKVARPISPPVAETAHGRSCRCGSRRPFGHPRQRPAPS